MKDTGKPPKTPKGTGKDPPRDMVYYAQKLAGQAASGSREDMLNTPAVFHTQPEEEVHTQGPAASPSQTLPDMEEDEEGDDTEQPSLAEILRAVHKCTVSLHTLQDQFGGLKEELGFIRHDLQKTRERTTAAEGRISELEDKITPLLRETQITARFARANELKSNDTENCLRRNNIRIVGLPEKTEGRDPTKFVEQWLLQVFGKEAFTLLYSVERAHRVPPRHLPPGHPPRTMIARLLNYKGKEIVLRQARERRNVQFNGARISFYPDYSAEIQKRRARFSDVKKRLQRLRSTYAMLFPVPEASSWLDANEDILRQAGRGAAEGD